PLHPGRPGRTGHVGDLDRTSHGRGHGHLRSGGGAQLRRQDRGGTAPGHHGQRGRHPRVSGRSRSVRAAALPAPAAAPDAGFAQDTIVGLVVGNAHRFPRRVALREKEYGIWQEYPWAVVGDQVTALAAGLAELGFGPGDALLILGDNRSRLYFGMLAAQLLRGIPCPVYADAIQREIAHVIRTVRPRFALAEDQEQVDKLLEL